jgi:hypothetical protein
MIDRADAETLARELAGGLAMKAYRIAAADI